MLVIHPSEMNDIERYKFLIGSIVPRPIAFITTLSEEGILNAAPFSFFNIVSSTPPMVSVSVQRVRGIAKDTARNAMYRNAFVVHICDEANVELVNMTSASLPSHVSEVESVGLTPIESKVVEVPGVQEAKIRMECILEQAIPLGVHDEIRCDLLLGRIVCFHVEENLYHQGRIDPIRLNPVSRLAGNEYATLGKIFEIERPR